MKRWAIVLISITLCMVVGNSVYATDDVTIYQEPQIQHKGRIVMNFFSTDSVGQTSSSSPIEGVQVELYYRYKKVMYNVKELDLFQYTNLSLTSDENGKIILSNLPYGLYQYKIISAPNGFEYNTDYVKIDLNLMNETTAEDIYLVKQIIMAEGTTEEIKEETKNEEVIEKTEQESNKEIENKEEVKTELLPSVKVEQENAITIPVEKNEEAIKKDISNLANDLCIKTEDTDESLTEEKYIIQRVSMELAKRAKQQKVDMIEKMKDIRITESIKKVVLSVDDTMYYLKSLSNSSNSDTQKFKETKKRILDRPVERKYRILKINTITRIRMTMMDRGVA